MRVVKDHVLSDSGEANLVKLKEDGQHMEGHQMDGQSLLLRKVNSARCAFLFGALCHERYGPKRYGMDHEKKNLLPPRQQVQQELLNSLVLLKGQLEVSNTTRTENTKQ